MSRSLLVCAVALLALCAATSVSANKGGKTTWVKFVAKLNATNSVPSINNTAVGTLRVYLKNGSESGKWTMHVSKIDNFTMSHIHLGNATTNGSPVLALAPTFPAAQNHTLDSTAQLPEFDPLVTYGKKGKSYSGSFNATDFINVGAPPPTWAEFVAALTTGNAYGNLHNAEYPNGVSRGQLVVA